VKQNSPPKRRSKKKQKKPDRQGLDISQTLASEIAATLAAFYSKHGRIFPWRTKPGLYSFAIAELLLQRTRAQNAVPVFKDIIRAYPAPSRLASAGPQTLRRQLRPLGLSTRRARDLRRLGAILTADYESRAIDKLPGLGKYGSRAVACFVFGERVGIADSNVRRVLSRILGLPKHDDRHITAEQSRFFQSAADLIASTATDPKATNYGFLDLAATICKLKPLCDDCPLLTLCEFGRSRSLRTKNAHN